MVWGMGGGSPTDCVGGLRKIDVSLPGHMGERVVGGKWSGMTWNTEGVCSNLCCMHSSLLRVGYIPS